ncbi:hypothetical protein F4804DRAFT_333267 [Jackrogersella minutella]|nr:hypothetical protein F4804DRAFT_333267 [Jackrogersella minutella]
MAFQYTMEHTLTGDYGYTPTQIQNTSGHLETPSIRDLQTQLEQVKEEGKELRKVYAENVEDLQFVRLHCARLQGEVANFKKPKRVSSQKKELQSSQARVIELETDLRNARIQNSELRKTATSNIEYWKSMYENSQTQLFEAQKKVEELAVENATLNMFVGPQQPAVTPPDEPLDDILSTGQGSHFTDETQLAPLVHGGHSHATIGDTPTSFMNSYGSQPIHGSGEYNSGWQSGYDFNSQP